MTLDFGDFEITTNRLGLRGAEINTPKPENEYRLLFLGDSVVLGWGADQRDLFLTLAENELNQAAESPHEYRCINTGHNRFDTTQEAALLEELGDTLAPDAVLLVYVNNDLDPTIRLWEELKRLQEDLASQPKSLPSRTKIWLVNGLRSVFRGMNDLLSFVLTLREQAKAVEEILKAQGKVDAEGWTASKEGLLQIKNWCRVRNIPFLVLNHTLPGDDTTPPEIAPLISFLEDNNIPHFPFYFTQQERKLPIRHSFSDSHANRLGHELLLKKLRPAIQHLGLKTVKGG